MADNFELQWKRPYSVGYPKVWHKFTAKDVDSDKLVEYRIEDLTESKYEESLAMMVEYFCRDEPTCAAYGVPNDPEAIDDFLLLWRAMIKQNAALICFKEGSDEIIGLNMNFVTVKDEHFMEDMKPKFKSFKSCSIMDAMFLLYENFEPFTHYNVDKYLGSVGLVVSSRYRGRAIGEHFLQTRRNFCNEFGIKLTSTAFTSNFSNRIADKVGFKPNTVISYDEIREKHPELKLPPINSDFLTVKSLEF